MNRPDKIINYIKKDAKAILISLVSGCLITSFLAVGSYAEKVSEDISNAVVRFHVLANSDEEFDQKLKLEVRDAVLAYLREDMNSCKSRDEAGKYLGKHTEEITEIAREITKAEGYDYEISTELSCERYPVRYYGNAVFPEGNYMSLKIIIGEGKGHNWWCVMYPPLCLNGEGIECADTEMLKEVLTNEGYEVVVLSSDNAVPEMKFKIVEWWASITS